MIKIKQSFSNSTFDMAVRHAIRQLVLSTKRIVSLRPDTNLDHNVTLRLVGKDVTQYLNTQTS